MPSAFPDTGPSLALVNGKVLGEAGCCEALAIAGNRIATLGTSAEIAACASSTTEIIDLAGRTVIPGLIDGHAHLDREGLKSALTREEALECATLGGAKLTFEDGEKGSIGVGKLADLAVLSADPLSCVPDERARIESELTIVDGRIVYRTEAGGRR